MAVLGCIPDRRGEGKMKIAAITLLSLALTTLASARAVPSCPAGSQQSTWEGTRGDNRYNCTLLPVTKDTHGLEQCLEWEGTHWSDLGVTVPCGSSVSSVSDTDQPEPNRFDVPSASELKAMKVAAAKAKAEQAEQAAKEKERQDKESGIAHLHLKVVKATWVTLGTTDANGYRHTQSRPIQRLTAVSLESKGQSVFDILCYGTSWSDSFGMSTQMNSCPALQVGETYLMDVGGRTVERDVPKTNKRVAWQVLELCNPAPSGCQQVSTLRDRE